MAVLGLRDENAAKEFRGALERLHAHSALQQWDKAAQGSRALIPYKRVEVEAAPQRRDSTPIISQQSLSLESFLTYCVRQVGDFPEKIGAEIGEVLSAAFPALKRSAEGAGRPGEPREIIVQPLSKIVEFLDNHEEAWSNLADGSPTPSWFNSAKRRRIAAHVVKACVGIVAGKQKLRSDSKEFSKAVETSQIPNLIDHVSTLLPSRWKKCLRMSVSPFPEDRMIFAVLSKAAMLGNRLSIKQVDTPWGEPNLTNRDVSLINEWVDLPQVDKSQPGDDIFRHRGYFAFAAISPSDKGEMQGAPEDRFRLAFRLGLERYQLGEYRTLLRTIRSRLGEQDLGSPPDAAPDWTHDFESFVAGESSIYVGGSINARLLLRVWKGLDRISILCSPADFEALLKKSPANRLVLGSALLEATPKARLGDLEKWLHKLYRSASMFLHKAACDARRDPSGWGRAVIRHLLDEHGPKQTDRPRGILWNFVVTEEDMISLILEDNDFALGEA